MSERIQKMLSSLGYGSRREIEEWVLDGRLTVNGTTAEVGQKIAEEDAVKLDGKRLSLKTGNEPMRVLLYKKRTGEMVTRDDPEGRRTVFRKLPDLETGRWIAVGRLDVNTSGLLLLTNHGELARRLMHPSFEQLREYAVRALGEVGDDVFAKMQKGVALEDGDAHFNSIRFGDNEPDLDTTEEEGEDAPQGRANHWFIVTIAEGRHREVRRLFESQGLTVNRLIRTGYGPIKLGRGIRSGSYREATADEITKLMNAVDLPHSERLPERVRASHQTSSEFSRSGPNALPNPKKKLGAETGWTKASKEERQLVERDERRVAKYGEQAVDKGPKKRSFSTSTGPRKPGAPSGERPYKSADGGAWKKTAPRSDEGSGDGQQFKARGFGAASTRSYSERGDGAPAPRPRFERSSEGERPAAKSAWGNKPKTESPYSARSGPQRSDRPAAGDSPWGKKAAPAEGSDSSASEPRQFKPRAKPFGDGSTAPRFGREGAASTPAWKKKPEGDRPAREAPAKVWGEKKPSSRDSAGSGDERPRFTPRTDSASPRRYGDEKPAYSRSSGDKPAYARSSGDKPAYARSSGDKPAYARSAGDKPAYPRKPAAPRKPGEKFNVRGGKAVSKLGLKRKPESTDE